MSRNSFSISPFFHVLKCFFLSFFFLSQKEGKEKGEEGEKEERRREREGEERIEVFTFYTLKQFTLLHKLFRQIFLILKKANLFILLPSDKEKNNIVVYGPCSNKQGPFPFCLSKKFFSFSFLPLMLSP